MLEVQLVPWLYVVSVQVHGQTFSFDMEAACLTVTRKCSTVLIFSQSAKHSVSRVVIALLTDYHPQTSLCTLTLTLFGGAAGSQVGCTVRLTVMVLHAGVESGIDQAGIISQEGNSGRVAAVIWQGGNGEF